MKKLVSKLGYKTFNECWRDWVNNFLTADGFASYHGITLYEAEKLLSYLYTHNTI